MPDDRIAVLIDYQNVYHRASASFFEGSDPPVQVGVRVAVYGSAEVDLNYASGDLD